jgi:copper(I)-binding protein
MKLSIKLLSLAILIAALVPALGACSITPTSPNIIIEEIWARQSPLAEGNGAAFMVIKNNGGEADALVGARTEISDVVELHETIMQDDVMRMRPIEGQRLEVPAGGEVMLAPGGLHIMFIDLNRQLNPDDTFPVILVFEKSGEMQVEVPVRAMEGMGSMENEGS